MLLPQAHSEAMDLSPWEGDTSINQLAHVFALPHCGGNLGVSCSSKGAHIDVCAACTKLAMLSSGMSCALPSLLASLAFKNCFAVLKAMLPQKTSGALEVRTNQCYIIIHNHQLAVNVDHEAPMAMAHDSSFALPAFIGPFHCACHSLSQAHELQVVSWELAAAHLLDCRVDGRVHGFHSELLELQDGSHSVRIGIPLYMTWLCVQRMRGAMPALAVMKYKGFLCKSSEITAEAQRHRWSSARAQHLGTMAAQRKR
jgi:hypothetical protein